MTESSPAQLGVPVPAALLRDSRLSIESRGAAVAFLLSARPDDVAAFSYLMGSPFDVDRRVAFLGREDLDPTAVQYGGYLDWMLRDQDRVTFCEAFDAAMAGAQK